MAYTQQTWADHNGAYPVSADRMNHMEAGIAAATVGGASTNYPVKTLTASATALTTDRVILCDATIPSFIEVALPTAVGNAGLVYIIRKIDSHSPPNPIVTKPVSGQTLDGIAADGNGWFPAYLRSQWDELTIISDGANWHRLDQPTHQGTALWVDAANGNDAYTGRSYLQAKKTISAAVTAAGSNGATIYIGPGFYSETVTCNIAGGVRLIGLGISGIPTMIKAPSDSASALVITAGNVYAENLTLSGTGTETYTGTLLSHTGGTAHLRDFALNGAVTATTIKAGTYGGVGMLVQDVEENMYSGFNINNCNLALHISVGTVTNSKNTFENFFFGVCFKGVLEDSPNSVQGPGANTYRRWKGANFYCPTASGYVVDFNAFEGALTICDSIDLFEGADNGTGTWRIAGNGYLFRGCANAGGTQVVVTGNDNEFHNFTIQDTFTIQAGAQRTRLRRMMNSGGAPAAGVTDGGTSTRHDDYQNTGTFGTNYVLNGRIYQAAAPASSNPYGTNWAVGDEVFSTTPAALGFIGWVCTVAGSPGTWKTFGAVTP